MAAKKTRQAELPGVEKPSNAELDAALELYAEVRDSWVKARTEVQAAKAKLMEYAEVRDSWVKARTEVQAAKAKLMELAKANGVTLYRDDNASPPLVMVLKEREASLKVTTVAGAVIDEGDEGDDGGEE